jgi:hypothetical protein
MLVFPLFCVVGESVRTQFIPPLGACTSHLVHSFSCFRITVAGQRVALNLEKLPILKISPTAREFSYVGIVLCLRSQQILFLAESY